MDDKPLFEKVSDEKRFFSVLEKKRFLIDTNTLSEPLRPEPNKKVLAKIKHHQSEIATAAQVLFEITSGCYLSSVYQRFSNPFLSKNVVMLATVGVRRFLEPTFVGYLHKSY